MPIAAAVALHVLVLLSSARPTLIGSATRDAPPAMLVRMLELHAANDEAVTAAEPAAMPVPSARVAAPEVSPAATAVTSTTGRRAAAVASSDVVVPAPIPSVAPSASPAAPGLPAAPAYLAAGRLDPGPRPLEDIEPVYPEEANQQEGSVVLRLLINEAGRIDNAAVVRAYPPGLFEKAALDAFGSARFSPGMRFGVAVKSQITIEVMFTPINRGARVSGRSY